MRRATLPLVFLALTLLAAGCGKRRDDPILQLSAAEALEQGKALMADEKFAKAGQYFTHAFEVEPNSRSGREALLLAADALYLAGGEDNHIRCEAKYRDFLNRFPTSDRSDYAQLQVANCLAERAEKPDRDQAVTRKALQAYQELLRLYPASPYTEEARTKIREVTDRLAAHELAVGEFYSRYGRGTLCNATIQRLEYLRQEYPDFSQMDSALFHLGKAYDRCKRLLDAEAAFQELQSKYPESPYLAEVAKLKIESLDRADRQPDEKATPER